MRKLMMNKVLVITLVIITTAVIFISNIFIPLGFSVWIFFIIPLLIVYFGLHVKNLIPFSGLVAFLTIINFILNYYNSNTIIAYNYIVFNRTLGILLFFTFAILLRNQKIARNRIKEREVKLRELNTTKDKLFSIIAHDLRSPFNSIIGFSELLSENIQDYDIKQSKEFITYINLSAKHTLNLLDNLLNWAKTQTGQIEYKPTKLSLQPIILEIMNLLNSPAKIKNISLNYTALDNISVNADQNMLQTILRNLISNSIKFTNNGGRIEIITTIYQDQVKITVTDTGIGMDEETINKLFRLDIHYTTQGTANEKGSGLGLILCKDFIEKHGGKIWVESSIGHGSSFIFTLPLVV